MSPFQTYIQFFQNNNMIKVCVHVSLDYVYVYMCVPLCMCVCLNFLGFSMHKIMPSANSFP